MKKFSEYFALIIIIAILFFMSYFGGTYQYNDGPSYNYDSVRELQYFQIDSLNKIIDELENLDHNVIIYESIQIDRIHNMYADSLYLQFTRATESVE